MPESFRAFIRQLVTNIPDTHVCNNLDSHFYHYTKDRWRIEPASCSNFKKFTSGVSGTNPTFDYTRGPCFAFRVGKLTCSWLVLVDNRFVLRQTSVLALLSVLVAVCFPVWNFQSHFKFCENLLRFLSLLNEKHKIHRQKHYCECAKRKNASWIGHIWRRNCLLKHVIEGKLEGRIETKGRRGRRDKQLLYDLKENRR
jgi:hypothetical protein